MSVLVALAPIRSGVRLGVDVGSVRIGVAACDADGLLAWPLETVARDPRTARDLDRLAALVAEHAPLEVVVGLPLSLSGRSGAAVQVVTDWARTLAAAIAPVPVRLLDERLSTVAAHDQLHAAGVRSRARRSVVDQAAAVIILQGALDAERTSGRAPGQLLDPR